MSGDYLWDRSGKPDPETEKLEHVLGRLRYDRPAPEFPETLRAVGLLARVGFSPRWFFPSLAAAFATVFIVLGLAWVSRSKAPVGEGWNVTFVAGTPRVGMASPGTSEATSRLGVGQTLETDGQSRARIRFEDIGEIRIDPDTRLRVLTSPTGASRLALDRGTIHARIWASPGNFVVGMRVHAACRCIGRRIDSHQPGLGRIQAGRSRIVYPGRRRLRHANQKRPRHTLF
jgi:hypothetical protein